MLELTGRSIFTEKPVKVTLTGDRISRVEEAPETASMPYISPGFLDIQVNGFNGIDYSAEDLNAEQIEALVLRFGQSGVSRHLPTFVTMPQDRLLRNLALAADTMEKRPIVKAGIPAFHIEGPFISADDGPRGAHNKKYVVPPDYTLFQKMQEAAGGRIKLVTMAPELPGAMDFIKTLVKTGVKAAIGHSGASPEIIREAIDAGASCSTHLGNGSHQVLPRHKNYIWEQMASDELMAGLISDGFHLPQSVVKVIARAKQFERLILVSYTSVLGGYKPGFYHWNDLDVEVFDDGHLCLAGTTALAGAGHLLDWDIACFMNCTGASLKDAITLCTLQPARYLDMDTAEYSSFSPGLPANLVLFEYTPNCKQLKILQTISQGRLIHGGSK
jgi:N-acetylglucosamine-6-phosphate deacetylase